eukprot:COSAG01_NODE_109_length_25925_cov_48.384961_15_plen_110_part_00
MNNEIVKIDLETYKNIITMLTSGSDDRELAIKCIENIELSSLMIKLLCKPVNTVSRAKILYSRSTIKGKFTIYNWTDLTLDEIEKNVYKSSVQAEKDIFYYLKDKYLKK